MKKKFKRRSYVETPSQTKKRERKEKLIKDLFVYIIWLFCMGFIMWFIFSWVRALFLL